MLNIVFAHASLGQFKTLHKYLCKGDLVKSWLACDEVEYQLNKDLIPNLISIGDRASFEPAGPYYLRYVERANRISLAIAKALDKHLLTEKIDLYVGHIIYGSPIAFFGNYTFPIITYAEFPCFRIHGWDTRYPPPKKNELLDKNMEMLILYSLGKSDKTIVPSLYAKNLFPPEFASKIIVQQEGFDFVKRIPEGRSDLAQKKIGFFARDLSSAKGVEHFIDVAVRLSRIREDVEFVLIGSPSTPYGNESEFLVEKYGADHKRTFVGHLLEKYGADLKRFKFKGFLRSDEYSKVISDIDFFLYPLQFGSFNWGFFELLMSGAAVVASNRCYLPEIIEDGFNGFLLELNRVDDWVRLANHLLNDETSLYEIKANALGSAGNYRIELIAEQYVAVFQSVLADHQSHSYV